ncbi:MULTISPECIES: hypothetical protein [Curtobacterium]|uniref:Uncharacterized protein n=1 Tax=Curtobacterium pusillum TaxID=69373 RepID=A0AAW3TCH3_9MICO|nr:hypothetical protein [Curtobacterium pusillum]MBA8992170.1 hypothetical protein [Curtobacterium pusillum]NUU12329.1 hypothetical protein [Curtobacterium pusillum]
MPMIHELDTAVSLLHSFTNSNRLLILRHPCLSEVCGRDGELVQLTAYSDLEQSITTALERQGS